MTSMAKPINWRNAIHRSGDDNPIEYEGYPLPEAQLDRFRDPVTELRYLSGRDETSRCCAVAWNAVLRIRR